LNQQEGPGASQCEGWLSLIMKRKTALLWAKNPPQEWRSEND
jgi:hypothetical protein